MSPAVGSRFKKTKQILVRAPTQRHWGAGEYHKPQLIFSTEGLNRTHNTYPSHPTAKTKPTVQIWIVMGWVGCADPGRPYMGAIGHPPLLLHTPCHACHAMHVCHVFSASA